MTAARSLWEFRLLSVHVPPIRLNYEGAAWIPKLYRHGFNRETMDRWIIPRYGEMSDLSVFRTPMAFLRFNRFYRFRSVHSLTNLLIKVVSSNERSKKKQWKNTIESKMRRKKKLNSCNAGLTLRLLTSALFIRKHKRHVSKFSITGPIPGIFFISHDR